MSEHTLTTAAAAGRGAAVAGGNSDHDPEPMTSQQADILKALCEKRGVAFDQTLSREAAEVRIAHLKDDSILDSPRDE